MDKKLRAILVKLLPYRSEGGRWWYDNSDWHSTDITERVERALSDAERAIEDMFLKERA